MRTRSLSEEQEDKIRRIVARYWSVWRHYQQDITERQPPISDSRRHIHWQQFVHAVTPLVRTIYATAGEAGLRYAQAEWARLLRLQHCPGVSTAWWKNLVEGLPTGPARWRPSQSPHGRPRTIKQYVAPEHQKPITRLAEQFRQMRDDVTRQYLVRRMFEIGGVAGVDYAAHVLQIPPEQLYNHYPLHISRAIRSGRSGRNARRKGPLGKRALVEKAQWSWANRMLEGDRGCPEDLGGKREGRHMQRRTSGSLRNRQMLQSLLQP